MKKIAFIFLVTVILSSCMVFSDGKEYSVRYIAETQEAKDELWIWIMKNREKIFPPNHPVNEPSFAWLAETPYYVRFYAQPGSPDSIIIRAPVEYKDSESFKKFRKKIEDEIGPRLMLLLKVKEKTYYTYSLM